MGVLIYISTKLGTYSIRTLQLLAAPRCVKIIRITIYSGCGRKSVLPGLRFCWYPSILPEEISKKHKISLKHGSCWYQTGYPFDASHNIGFLLYYLAQHENHHDQAL
jgi:hypothetical protein